MKFGSNRLDSILTIQDKYHLTSTNWKIVMSIGLILILMTSTDVSIGLMRFIGIGSLVISLVMMMKVTYIQELFIQERRKKNVESKGLGKVRDIEELKP